VRGLHPVARADGGLARRDGLGELFERAVAVALGGRAPAGEIVVRGGLVAGAPRRPRGGAGAARRAPG
jgi:hypothetical protein